MQITQRKLIKQGANTLTITLPSRWIKLHELKQGDVVDVVDQGQKVEVTPLRGAHTQYETTVHFQEAREKYIKIMLTNLYRSGYENINITWDDDAVYPLIERYVQTLLFGFEMTKKEGRSCRIEQIASQDDTQKIETVFRRVFLLILETFEETHSKGVQKEALRLNAQRCNKLLNLCIRSINTSSHSDLKTPQILLANYLIDLAQAFVHLSKYVEEKRKLTDEEKQLLKEAHQLFDAAYSALFSKKVEKMRGIGRKARHLIDTVIYEKLESQSDSVCIYHIGEIVRTVYFTTSPIALWLATLQIESGV